MAEPKTRNATGCLIVILVLVLLLLVPVALFWFFVRSLEGQRVKVASGSVLEVDLGAVAGEGPSGLRLGPLFGPPTLSLFELGRTIDAAAGDDDIVAIRIVLRGAWMGWASAEEVLGHLDAFRDRGKPIYALLEGDVVDDLTYFLATAADRVWIAPATAAAVNGLVVEAPFFRGTLDKLHIEPQVLMLGVYKSAGEPFLNYEMSPYMRESIEDLLATTHRRFLERVSQRRAQEPAAIEATLRRTLHTAGDMIAAGLADEIGYLDQLDDALLDSVGVDEYRGVTAVQYLGSAPSARTRGGGDRIALVFGEGPVLTEAPPAPLPFLESKVLAGARVAEHFQQATEDDSIKAIVFRVNSPGGSAVGSDIVRRAIEEAKAAGKTVVVSMSDVAGSGGYWVAMGADAIVAHPTTITGSIGVVFTKLNLDGFFAWMGTNIERLATAPGAGALGLGPLEESERQAILGWMDAVYDLFTEHVAAGRELDLARVREVAQGRVWSGRDALEIGLIDRLGGLEEAFTLAKEMAGLDPERRYPLEIFPRPRSLYDALFNPGRTAAATWLGRSGVEEWLDRATSPQVLARAPEIRIR
ncbi:MAG TPA: signal peptide peptidase SppA [Thermoanaerobaculia bacterium]|nr:signal peptide peptidase SppA [Thermoanaerobaculia bacterium]